MAKVIVIGCYAQLKPEEISSIPGVSLVLGAAEKFNILKHINELDEFEQQALSLDQYLMPIFLYLHIQ